MALDKVLIGERIRNIRENIFEESRKNFARRCDITDRHIAQIERGDFLFSLATLDKIVSATGIDVDYILYGKGKHKGLNVYNNLQNIIDRADADELQMYHKCITAIGKYVNKKFKKSW